MINRLLREARLFTKKNLKNQRTSEDVPPEEGIRLWFRSPPVPGQKRTPLLPCHPGADSAHGGIDFTKPMFFCLGGQHTSNLADTNGFAKNAETMLGGPAIHETGVQLISMQYERRYDNHAHEFISATARDMALGQWGWNQRNEGYAKRYAKKMANDVFSSIIPDLSQTIDKTQRERALEECQSKFAKVNFFVHSFGSYMLPFVHAEIQNEMMGKGFSSDECRKTLRNVHVISIGETGLWHHQPKKTWDFTSIHFVSTYDDVARRISGIDSKILTKQQERFRLMQFGEEGNVALLAGNVSNIGYKARHSVEKGRYLDEIKMNSHHPHVYMGVYTNVGGGSLLMRTALQSALRNSLQSSLSGYMRGIEAKELLQIAPPFGIEAVDRQPHITDSAHPKRVENEEKERTHYLAYTGYYPYQDKLDDILSHTPARSASCLPHRRKWATYVRETAAVANGDGKKRLSVNA